MIPEIGYYSLIIILCTNLLQAYPGFSKLKYSSLAGFIFSILSFSCLLYSHIVSDFSVSNVYNNSHTAKPMLYKIAGTWGNHEGSMLLLVFILSAYNFAFAYINKLPSEIKNNMLRVQSLITSCFTAFIIFTSSPFLRIFPIPENGLGLNPLLQDVGLASHPPILYTGYIGLSIGFSFSIATLIAGRIENDWIILIKKWIQFSWSFLTLGIGLGSWWAYRELGWGGFWFWDPVENCSLMPWLAATAFMHSILVLEKRNSLPVWTILLGIFSFCLSLLGIFLVRSGILTSVHSFANDPARGIFILAFLGTVILASLTLFAARAHKLSSNNTFTFFSKEGYILINNLLLSVACLTVLLGTLYPIFLEVFSKTSVSVGAPYFNSIFLPITLPLLCIASIAPYIKWQEDDFINVIKQHCFQTFVGVVTFTISFLMPEVKSTFASLFLALAATLIASMLNLIIKQTMKNGYKKIPINLLAMAVAHIGLGVLAIGITTTSFWGTEQDKVMQLDDKITVANYTVEMKEMYITAQDNYMARQGFFYISNSSGKNLEILKPEVRYYPVEQTNTTEAAIYYSLLSNVYVAMGDSDGKGGYAVRIYYKPLVNMIWLGCVLMSFGGLLALLKRKK